MIKMPGESLYFTDNSPGIQMENRQLFRAELSCVRENHVNFYDFKIGF